MVHRLKRRVALLLLLLAVYCLWRGKHCDSLGLTWAWIAGLSAAVVAAALLVQWSNADNADPPQNKR